MPKILFISDTQGNGGAERQLTLLVKSLPPEWECCVWGLDDGPYLRVLQEAGVEVGVGKRKWKKDVSPALDLWRKVNSWRPDIVHALGWMSALAAVPICRALRIPLVNGSLRTGRRPVRRSLPQMLALKFANRVIANSQAGLDAWGISRPKGVVINNGFDPERLLLCKPIKRLDSGGFTVVMAGRMVPERDFKTFIRAAGRMSESGLNAHFMALGNGNQRSEIIKLAGDLIRKGYISFPEAGMEIIPFLNRANVGVLMSNANLAAEGISNVIMEYMACGLPVICSNSGGNRELVQDGVTGYVIPPADADVLIEKLVEIYDNPIHAATMGLAGRKRIEQEFTASKMVQQTVKVYQEVLH
jgi:glycosyltransferase involved in cell wall biosynthesis